MENFPKQTNEKQDATFEKTVLYNFYNCFSYYCIY